jgi:hypothetical protein
MSKQTAVEWLIKQLHAPCRGIPSDIIEQANKMDKEQKAYFFQCGRQYQLTGEGTFTEVHNETFNTHNRLETIFGKIEKSEWEAAAEKRQSEKTKLGRSTKTSWSD